MIDDMMILVLGVFLLVGTPELAEALDPTIYYRSAAQTEAVDVPKKLRHANWGGGSCTYASTSTVLEQHGYHNLAGWLRRNRSGGAGVSDIASVYDKVGIKYKSTQSGDASVLEYASDHRQMATCYYYGGHCITFCGFQTRNGKEYAVLLDNNRTHDDDLDWIRKETFLRRWRNNHDGGAILPLLDPVPSLPRNPLDYKVQT